MEFDFSQLSEDTVGLDVSQVLAEQAANAQGADVDTTPPDKGVESKEIEELNPLDILNSKTDEQVTATGEEDVIGDNKTKTPPQKNKPSADNLPFSLVFKSLLEEGVLSNFDEEVFGKELTEVGQAQAIVNVFAKEAESARQAVRAEAEEDFKEYAKLKDLGIDTQTAQSLIATKIEFEKITPEQLESEENLELRKEVITRNLLNTTNWSEAKIKKQVELTIDSGKDVEEAKESLVAVNQFNKEQIKLVQENKIKEEAAKQAQRDELTKSYKDFIDKLDEPIPGVKVNKQTKTKIEQKVLSGSIWETRKADPVKFDVLVQYFIDNGGLDGKFDKPSAKAKTNAIKELESAIASSKKTDSGIVIQDNGDEEEVNSGIYKHLGVKR